MDYDHLQSIREHELDRVLARLRPGQRVLEIGAGAGWQARKVADAGCDVVAIDVAETNYLEQQVFPVATYDGERIPLPDRSVDVVFSSNVLEHIPHIERFQAEMERVLKPDGFAIHLMPSTSWRFWTSVALYAHVVKSVFNWITKRPGPSATTPTVAVDKGTASPRSISRTLRHALLPAVHGERGNFITELHLFSARRWRRLFEAAGWRVESVQPNDLFYTGHAVIGAGLDITTRKALSRWFGSACNVYVLRCAHGRRVGILLTRI